VFTKLELVGGVFGLKKEGEEDYLDRGKAQTSHKIKKIPRFKTLVEGGVVATEQREQGLIIPRGTPNKPTGSLGTW